MRNRLEGRPGVAFVNPKIAKAGEVPLMTRECRASVCP
ncbi:hypothetical protein B4099_2743 [Heyndrickxia coagulans]|uniref:Uncharacterized protein n=1 Tax=Heyndrickxia coagulans TaxID=1398 RepID=A0A150KLA3_HEYCO|nr:hypothetical protein B4099_2743 [Heyndrickxia coagulans]